MKYLAYIASVAAIATGLAVASCDESTIVGSSLIENDVEIVVDSTYTVSGYSVENSQVRSRTVTQLLGSINVDGFGSLSSDVVTQFISSETIDTTGVTVDDIDSVKLVLGMPHGSFVGDSVVPMGIEVYPLIKQLESPIYSNFDPEGYYDSSNCWGSTIYAATVNNLTNANEIDDTYRMINVDLPIEFGRAIFQQYVTSPETFQTPQAFTKWFPGLYIKNSFGNGRIVSITSSTIRLFYHDTEKISGTERDTIINRVGNYMAVSPEVITNNNIHYSMSNQLKERAAAGEAILAAPIGFDVEFRFPAREIIETFHNAGTPMAVMNSLTFEIPAKLIANNYGLLPPPYILMVKKSKKDEFFNKAKLPDNLNSFYASYNQATGKYEFTAMLDYITDMVSKDEITDEDIDFVFTPVSATYVEALGASSSFYYYYGYGYGASSSATLESIVPYVMTPVMCSLDFKNAKVKFTYSKQKI
ncbi:MAG: DUF4270 family protein [Muribaculaceae bacterium]|nr:DUF4270 family protein [Muribaculaceae bacterium]